MIALFARLALVAVITLRATKRRSLTPTGVAAAAATGTIYSVAPSGLPLTLVVVCYALGIKATRYKHAEKAHLVYTIKLPSASSGSIARTHVQVFCNSLPATILVILILISRRSARRDYVIAYAGIVAQFCAATADSLASEIGILDKNDPILCYNWTKTVPKGTNGGVSRLGLLAGLAGSFIISLLSLYWFWPFLEAFDRIKFVAFFTASGAIGSFIDSLLGALFQQTLIDPETNKVVEVDGGGFYPETEIKNKKSVSGADMLSNNGVNMLTVFIVTALSMVLFPCFFPNC